MDDAFIEVGGLIAIILGLLLVFLLIFYDDSSIQWKSNSVKIEGTVISVSNSSMKVNVCENVTVIGVEAFFAPGQVIVLRGRYVDADLFVVD